MQLAKGLGGEGREVGIGGGGGGGLAGRMIGCDFQANQ